MSTLDPSNERPAMLRLPKPARPAALLLIVMLVAGACSSSVDGADTDAAADTDSSSVDDDSTESTTDDTTDDTDDEASAETGDAAMCEELGRLSANYRSANGWVPQVVDAESEELIGGDYDALLAVIEGLRPIQDIEGIFGASRQGLDNMQADVIALQEGRFADKVGDYGAVTVTAVIAEEVCG